MISKETSARIWQCYREIETAINILNEMEELERRNPSDPHAQHLKDSFGHRRNLQLGIPIGENAHRLVDVAPKLAKSIIRAHIENKKAELYEANEQAMIEYDSQPAVEPGEAGVNCGVIKEFEEE